MTYSNRITSVIASLIIMCGALNIEAKNIEENHQYFHLPQSGYHHYIPQIPNKAASALRYTLSGTLAIMGGTVSACLANKLDDKVDGKGLVAGVASIPCTILAYKLADALAPRDKSNTTITTGLAGLSYLTTLAVTRQDKNDTLFPLVSAYKNIAYELFQSAFKSLIPKHHHRLSINIGGRRNERLPLEGWF